MSYECKSYKIYTHRYGMIIFKIKRCLNIFFIARSYITSQVKCKKRKIIISGVLLDPIPSIVIGTDLTVKPKLEVDHSLSFYILITNMFKLSFNKYIFFLNLLFKKRAHADGALGVDTRFFHSFLSSVSGMGFFFFTVKHIIDNDFFLPVQLIPLLSFNLTSRWMQTTLHHRM